eukprot:PITA_01845
MMNSNSYWNATNPPWEEPEYEPVSPPVQGSNPTPDYVWNNVNNSAKPRTHQLNLPSEPPQKRVKTLESPPLQPAFPFGSPNPQAGGIPRPRPSATGSLQKTKLCARFEAGTCTFNDNCSFAHGAEELRRPTAFGGGGSNIAGSVNLQRFHKTRPCKFFLGGNCPYRERCNFLHDTEQGQFNNAAVVRAASSTRPPNWKTKLCVNWGNSQNCNFGDKCHFAHGFGELQKYGGGMLQAESGASVHGVMKPSNNFSVSYVDPVNNGFMHGSEGHKPGPGFTATEASLSTVSYLNDNTYKGTNTLPYQNPQEVASNYGYNSDPNDWERSGQAVRPDFNQSQIYSQATHQEPWASHYYTTGQNSEREEEPGSSSYMQNLPYP